MEEKQAKKRLEEIRKSIIAENVSYGELAELQSLRGYIEEGDVQLLEVAGVPEFSKAVRLTREQVINDLVDDEIDHMTNSDNYGYLEMVLINGFKGFKDYSDAELIEEWENNLGDGQYLVIVEGKKEVKNG